MDPFQNEINEIQPRKHSVFYKLVAIVVALGLILLSIQAYFYLIRPEPVNIPTLDDVRVFLELGLEAPFSSHDPEEVREVVESIRQNIKPVANFIAAESCGESDRLCQSKALFYFVRDEIQYVADEQFHDQLENPLTVLKTGGADCEDMSVLLIALQKAIGNQTNLVFVPGHAFAQVSIPDYKNGEWIHMDATCDSCQFGELSNSVVLQERQIFEI